MRGYWTTAWRRSLDAGTIAISIALAIGLISVRATIAADLFSLVDADGRTVTSADFPGKWLLIYFGYTNCADQCPTALSTMTEALDEIGAAADHVQPLFITIDPERDGGPSLRAYTVAFDQRLVGLSGTPEQVAAAAIAFGAKYEKVLLGDADYFVDHSSIYYLVDPTRRAVQSVKLSEPYMIAATMLELLNRSGVDLRNVNNLGAYR